MQSGLNISKSNKMLTGSGKAEWTSFGGNNADNLKQIDYLMGGKKEFHQDFVTNMGEAQLKIAEQLDNMINELYKVQQRGR